MKKRIAIVNKNLEINGISSVIVNYSKKIDKNEFEISMLVGEKISPKYIRECQENDIEIVNLKNRKGIHYYKELYKALKQKKYDVIHINGSSATIGIELIISVIAGIKKRVVHSHNTECSHKVVHKMLKPIVRALATDKIACSNAAGKWMFNNNYIVLPNGFDVDAYLFNKNKRNEVRRKLNLESNFVIGHTGRINLQKNQEFLVKIMNEIISERKDAKMLLVGYGPEFNNIKELIKNKHLENRIILYGESSDTSEVYSAMDLFVFPSKYEGLGISLLEAQINGLDCLASKNVPMETNITDNVKYIELENKQEWIKLITTYKGNRNDIDINSEKIQYYNINNNVKQLEEIYEKVENN